MATELPSHARVVIVGGGIIGTSVAYHLAKLGWSDVLLLERGSLSCGTTWHAAGLVMQLRANHTLTKLCRYGAELYASLESETGQSTGFLRCGSLPVARTADRFHEIKRMASIGHCFGVELDILTPAEIERRHPMIDTRRVVGGLFIPGDGQTHPGNTTLALAEGARRRGATIVERVSVTGIDTRGGAVERVRTTARRRRLRDRRQLRRDLGPRDRPHGGRERSALRLRAHVRHHRADGRRASRSAGDPRHRRARLRQGRRRQADRGGVRARRQAAAARGAARRLRVRRAARGLGALRAADAQGQGAGAGARARARSRTS